MARHQGHDRLPRAGRMTRSDVVVDQARVAGWSIETLSQVFEEDPHKHGTDRDTNYCQPICRRHLVGLISCWAYIRRHGEPRSKRLHQGARPSLVSELKSAWLCLWNGDQSS